MVNTYNCNGLTGGGSRVLDSHSVNDLVNNDRAICGVSGELLYFKYNATGTTAEQVVAHPYLIRPNDYVTQGNWEEQVISLVSDTVYGSGWDGDTDIAPSKNVVYDEVELRTKAASVITDNRLIRGDGGVRGVQESTISVDDSGRMINTSQPCFQLNPLSNQSNIAINTEVTVVWGSENFDVGNKSGPSIFS